MYRLKIVPAVLSMVYVMQVLPAQTANQEVIFPIVATGSLNESTHFETVLRFLPLSAGGTAFYAVNGFDNVGGPYAVSCDFGPLSGFGEVFGEVPGRFSFFWIGAFQSGGPPRGCRFPNQSMDGWLKVTTPVGVRVSAEVNLIRDGQLLAAFSLPAMNAGKTFRALVVEAQDDPLFVRIPPINRQTAFSIVNPSQNETASIELAVIDSSGKTLLLSDQTPILTRFRLAPLSRVSRFLSEFLTAGVSAPIKNPIEFSARREQFFMIKITSDIPIAVGAVQMLSFATGLQFTPISVEITQ